MTMSSDNIPIDDLTDSDVPCTYTDSQIETRCKLAAVYRLVSLYGWSQVIYNHITVRTGTDGHNFLINPFGLLYHEVTASSLITVDLDGNVIDPGSSRFTFNRPGFVLHSAVHRARPELTALMHLHHPAIVAVSSMDCGLLPVSQEAAIVGPVSYHEYRGLVVDANERDEIAKDLGQTNQILILRNHGVLVCGQSIEEMLHLAHNLVLACETQIRLTGVGFTSMITMSEQAKAQAYHVVRSGFQAQGDGQESKTSQYKPMLWDLEFEAQMRWLDSKPELIESRGFKSETHSVVTDDQYVVTVFRIINPYANQSEPVLLWHGLTANSDSWLISRSGYIATDGVYREDESSVINDCKTNLTSTLAFTLAACGRDVWLANTRGNQYSNKHTRYNSSDAAYYDYTITELAAYDIPAVIQYILQNTGRESLSYIGHSLGTTTMFALLSVRPEYERYINLFIALAPVAFFSNVKSNLVQMAPLEPLIRPMKFSVGVEPLVAQLLGTSICGNDLFIDACIEIYGQTYGTDHYNTDKARFPIFLANSFDKISVRVIVHYAQLINSGRFQYFNYPTILDNYRKYGRFTPPDYPLQDIRSNKIVLFHGNNDYLSDVRDIQKLVNQMNVKPMGIYAMEWHLWNHIDFQWAIHSNKYLNPTVLQLLNNVTQP